MKMQDAFHKYSSVQRDEFRLALSLDSRNSFNLILHFDRLDETCSVFETGKHRWVRAGVYTGAHIGNKYLSESQPTFG